MEHVDSSGTRVLTLFFTVDKHPLNVEVSGSK